MYIAYFGLKEKPFSIAPDPQYLFMSDRHREALAHLTYGLGDAGGFVLLTGEVGTGKTTVSRCLMERLPENTQAAFILNPTLSSHELLATICDELKIRYRKTGATLKTLTDKIQDKLLKNHKADINTLLIIDEAQHLQPEVLEQLRLLTNLETNTKKLLQVILIGQPELQTLLKRRDLRQLAQRITARYHLLPLNKQEVAQYIKHRISIAEGIRALFSTQAMNTIHKICGGIPRLINLVCERALLNAYSANTGTVNKKIVLLSAQEALGDDYEITYWWQNRAVQLMSLSTIVVLLAVGAYLIGSQQIGLSGTEKIQTQLESKPSNVAVLTEQKLNEQQPEKAQVEEQSLATHTPAKVDEIITSSVSTTQRESESYIANMPKEVLVNNQTVAAASVVTDDKENTVVADDTQAVQKVDVTPLATPLIEPVEGVSTELLNRFKEAIDADSSIDDTVSEEYADANATRVEPIEKMPLWVQNSVPKLQFDMHIYASDGQGWVKVNGRDRYEGDNIARELTLVRILPQKVVLNFRGEKFTMRALSSW